jgi:hypothetical protein
MLCKIWLTISNNTVVKKKHSDNNHIPNLCKLEVEKEVEKMNVQALSSQNNLQQIIASSQINPFISGALPELFNLKHFMKCTPT